MVRGKDEWQWNHTAAITAGQAASNPFRKGEVDFAKFHPYRAKEKPLATEATTRKAFEELKKIYPPQGG